LEGIPTIMFRPKDSVNDRIWGKSIGLSNASALPPYRDYVGIDEVARL
jgi:hypothetical protein